MSRAEQPERSEESECRMDAARKALLSLAFEYDLRSGTVTASGVSGHGDLFSSRDQTIEEWKEALHPHDQIVLSRALESSARERAPMDCDVRWRNPDGTFRWVRMRGIHHYAGGQTPTHFNGFVETVHESGLQNDLASERDRTLRAVEELNEFTYVASHDLQEPLRTITGIVELLNADHRHQLDADGQEYLDFIGSAAASLQQLINDLLTYSRITTQTASFERVDLSEIAADALRNMHAAAEEAGAEVEIQPLPEVRGEASRLLLVLQNLLGNAIKFRAPGAVPEIRVRAAENEGFWRISVEDNGIGISPDQHQKIFRIFHRLRPASEYEGSGLGLAICERIVRRHGGRIWVESTPGEGAVFHFTLPR